MMPNGFRHVVQRSDQIRSLRFVPPLTSTADPDFAFIRASVRKALAAGSAPQPKTSRAATTPGPTGGRPRAQRWGVFRRDGTHRD